MYNSVQGSHINLLQHYNIISNETINKKGIYFYYVNKNFNKTSYISRINNRHLDFLLLHQ